MARVLPMAETLATVLSQMGPLVLGSVGTLAVTSVRHQPATVFGSAILSLILSKMTFNLGPTTTVFNSSREATALKSLVTTSNANRVVRMLLGACYVHGAITMSLRSAKSCSSRDKPGPMWRICLRWVGCAALMFIGATWLSTGFYGQ